MAFFTNGLTLRGIKKSALTHAELDNNFLILDSGLSNLQNQINLLTGSTDGRNVYYVPSGETFDIPYGKQALVVGDLLVDGEITNSGQLIFVNGSIILSGGTYVDNGGDLINYEFEDGSGNSLLNIANLQGVNLTGINNGDTIVWNGSDFIPQSSSGITSGDNLPNYFLPNNEERTVDENYQHFVYGDLTVRGTFLNDGKITVLDGFLDISSGGTIDNSGGGILEVTSTGGGGSGIIVEGTGTGSSERCGNNNNASGNYSTSLGRCNTASCNYSTVGGGYNNTACGKATTIAGGAYNSLSSYYAFIGGGQCNSNQSGSGWGVIVGGYCNHITCGYTTIGGGECNLALEQFSTVVGGLCNTAGCFGGGHSFVGAGRSNTAFGQYSSIVGGDCNSIDGPSSRSTISGGYCNCLDVISFNAFIGGGACNYACLPYTTIAGGLSNKAMGYKSTVGGGECNCTIGCTATVSGGKCNIAANRHATVSGGYCNVSCGVCASTVSGGFGNHACAWAATVAGGCLNTACGVSSTVSGGYGNIACCYNSTIGGGFTNITSCNGSTVSGGRQNTTSGSYSTISGGYFNTSSGKYSTVGGGCDNIASCNYSTIGGGEINKACGDYSGILGGCNNIVNNDKSFIIGSDITTNKACTTFVNSLNIVDTPITDSGSLDALVWDPSSKEVKIRAISGGTGNSNLIQDLTVQLGTGVQFGGVSTGQVFSASTTSLEQVLRSLLIKTIPPTYTQPSISMTNPTSQSYEIGTSVPSVTVSSLFTQNDAGPIQTHRLFRTIGVNPETEISSNNSNTISFADTTLLYLTATTQYRSNATYSDGNIKNDNLGNPYPSGRILSGTTPYASYRTLTPVRKLFYGGTNTTPTTSSDVRGLPSSQLNPQNGTSFSITSVAGTYKISFAYPSTLRDAISIIYNTGGNADASGNFTQTIVSVDGANNLLSTNYKVYTYTSLIEFTGAELYTITI